MKSMKLFSVLALTGMVSALLFWSVSNMKEEQPKGWIEEPSNELMDFKVK